jgi:hypothetical protein
MPSGDAYAALYLTPGRHTCGMSMLLAVRRASELTEGSLTVT